MTKVDFPTFERGKIVLYTKLLDYFLITVLTVIYPTLELLIYLNDIFNGRITKFSTIFPLEKMNQVNEYHGMICLPLRKYLLLIISCILSYGV